VFFRFDDHVLDVERCELRRGLEPVVLESQVFDLLELDRPRDNLVSVTFAMAATDFAEASQMIKIISGEIERSSLPDARAA
jgi:hypothetical protein